MSQASSSHVVSHGTPTGPHPGDSLDTVDHSTPTIAQIMETFHNCITQINASRTDDLATIESRCDSKVTAAAQQITGKIAAIEGNVQTQLDKLQDQIKVIIDTKDTGLSSHKVQNESFNYVAISTQLKYEGICFSGREDGLHPMEFVALLENRLDNHVVPFRHWLSLTLQCLDAIARVWAREQLFHTYSEFNKAFLERFWGPIAQSKLRKTIYSGKYTGSVAMSTYVRRLLKQNAFLGPPLSEEELPRHIIAHFPENVQTVLLPIADSTNKIVDILERFEAQDSSLTRPRMAATYAPPVYNQPRFDNRTNTQYRQNSPQQTQSWRNTSPNSQQKGNNQIFQGNIPNSRGNNPNSQGNHQTFQGKNQISQGNSQHFQGNSRIPQQYPKQTGNRQVNAMEITVENDSDDITEEVSYGEEHPENEDQVD
jgi:hypothetical protein